MITCSDSEWRYHMKHRRVSRPVYIPGVSNGPLRLCITRLKSGMIQVEGVGTVTEDWLRQKGMASILEDLNDNLE